MCAQIRNVDLNIYTKSSLCETKTWFQQKETVVKLSRKQQQICPGSPDSHGNRTL